MTQPGYNAGEIEKNLAMLERCTHQCLAKIAGASNDRVVMTLENRLKESWMFVDFAISALRDCPRDGYLDGVFGRVEEIRAPYKCYLNKKLDLVAAGNLD